MLKDLRRNRFVKKQPWTKSKQQGLCANNDCMETGTKECSRCGIRYCSEKCQNMDWKRRHKNHCELKNVRRTEIIFAIHKKRLEDYKTGKTSIDRYFSMALIMLYKDYYPECTELTPVYTPVYRIQRTDKSSGRILTVLEDHEMDSSRILRDSKSYLVNPNVPSVPLSDEEQQLRLAAGLPLKEATELVPLNQSIQLGNRRNDFEMIKRLMRKALNRDLQLDLLLIDMVISPGLGWGYGNPVFLSLQNALAYEDFIRKMFGLDEKFPFNLCCSILFPEFNLSMRTGNPEDADNFLDLGSEDKLVEKAEAPEAMHLQYAVIFDPQLMKKENEEEDAAFQEFEGESVNDRHVRFFAYTRKCDPWRYAPFNLAGHCSESLVVCAVDQTCFTDSESHDSQEGEGCQLLG